MNRHAVSVLGGHRALLYEFRVRLLRAVLVYVGDIIRASLREHGPRDRERARVVIEALLGSTSVAEDKTEWTSEIDQRLGTIGRAVDVRLQAVMISRRNLLRAIYFFCSVQEEGPVPVCELEAPWVFGLEVRVDLCRAETIHAALCGAYTGVHRTKSDPARALKMDEKRFARPFGTFTRKTAAYTIQYDAFRAGTGLEFFHRPHPGCEERTIGGGEVPMESYELGEDAAFQSTVEFLAGLVGLVGLIRWCRGTGAELEAVTLR